MSRTVARLLAESLEAHDVDQVYCVPGESYIGLTSALIERNSIRVIVCRHEGGAGYIRQFLPVLHRLYDAVFFHPKPVIAAINGHAIAGGAVLVVAGIVLLGL